MQDSELMHSLLTELRRGTLTLAVLSQLKQPRYGYLLLQRLEELKIRIEASTLYPLLRRLETQGLLQSDWDTTENRPRKYYVLSERGQEVYALLRHEWEQLSGEMSELMKEETQ